MTKVESQWEHERKKRGWDKPWRDRMAKFENDPKIESCVFGRYDLKEEEKHGWTKEIIEKMLDQNRLNEIDRQEYIIDCEEKGVKPLPFVGWSNLHVA